MSFMFCDYPFEFYKFNANKFPFFECLRLNSQAYFVNETKAIIIMTEVWKNITMCLVAR
jgi:hypothetical protein